jgi:hypothetical protein
VDAAGTVTTREESYPVPCNQWKCTHCGHKLRKRLVWGIVRVLIDWSHKGWCIDFFTLTLRVEPRCPAHLGRRVSDAAIRACEHCYFSDLDVVALCDRAKYAWDLFLKRVRRCAERCSRHRGLPAKHTTPRRCRRCKEYRERGFKLSYVAVWESTARGAPHVHVLMRNLRNGRHWVLTRRSLVRMWAEVTGQSVLATRRGFHHETLFDGRAWRLRSANREDGAPFVLARYFSGYFGKSKHEDRLLRRVIKDGEVDFRQRRKYTTSRDVDLGIFPRSGNECVGMEFGLEDAGLFLRVPKEELPWLYRNHYLFASPDGVRSPAVVDWMVREGMLDRIPSDLLPAKPDQVDEVGLVLGTRLRTMYGNLQLLRAAKPAHCRGCQKKAMVYVEPNGFNTCVECGYWWLDALAADPPSLREGAP